MKTLLSITLAAAFALCGQAFAGDEPTPLTEAEMDTVTAGALVLPNGDVMFSGFDNAAPGEFHPNFERDQTAFDQINVQPGGGTGHGPWSAAFNSPVIEFQPI